MQIKKVGEKFMMGQVKVERIVTVLLPESEWLELKIAPDCFHRRTCGCCGRFERPDIYSVQAFSRSSEQERSFWICDQCVEKWAPELLPELKKERDAAYKMFAEGQS